MHAHVDIVVRILEILAKVKSPLNRIREGLRAPKHEFSNKLVGDVVLEHSLQSTSWGCCGVDGFGSFSNRWSFMLFSPSMSSITTRLLYDDDVESCHGLIQSCQERHLSIGSARPVVSTRMPDIMHDCSSPTIQRHDVCPVRPSMSCAHECNCGAATFDTTMRVSCHAGFFVGRS